MLAFFNRLLAIFGLSDCFSAVSRFFKRFFAIPGLFDRFSAIPGLMITSVICYSLLYRHLHGWRASDSLVHWVNERRSLVTVLVQLLSQILGLIHVHVFCALLRSSLLTWIATKAFPLHFPHFVQAITSPKITWSTLPKRYIMMLIVMFATCAVPAPLWAAAITPRPAERLMSSTIKIPTFNIANVSQLWEGNYSTTVLNQWMTPYGLFGFSPEDWTELLLVSARDASVVKNGTRQHAKLDKTGFSNEGRSYGTGGTAGFAEAVPRNDSLWYSYTEIGFNTEISCFHCPSSYQFLRTSSPDSVIALYQVHEYLADGSLNPTSSAVWPAWLPHDLFGWFAKYNQSEQKIVLQTFMGAENKSDNAWHFDEVNDIRCDMRFTLQKVNVTVNNTNRLVSSVATPIPFGETGLSWPHYGDVIISDLVRRLNYLTQSDTCVNGCSIGRNLLRNLYQLYNQTSDTSNNIKFAGVGDFFGSIIDNMLVSLAVTRWVSGAPEPTEDVSAVIAVPSLVIGDKQFIVIIVVLNLVLSTMYIIELLRTRAWNATPPLDIMNDSEVIIAAFEGGRLFERRRNDSATQCLEGQHISGKTTLKLQYDGSSSSRPILVPHSASEDGKTRSPDSEDPLLGLESASGFENIPLEDKIP